MLAFLPIIGPIAEGIIGLFKNQQDVSLKKYQEDTLRQGKETDADVAVINARAQVSIQQNSLGNQLMRDVVMFPVAVHTLMSYWDAIFVKHTAYVFGVAQVPENLQYIPYAVIAYLFVTAYRGR